MERRLFALDHNFPEPLLQGLASSIPDAELVPIRLIDATFADLDDWELLLALRGHVRPWDGLITNDDAMLSLPKELVVLQQTQLTLVVAKGEGHNPVRAVGVLLCHLAHVCRHTTRERAQVWNFRVTQKNYEAPDLYLDKVAMKTKTTAKALFERHKVAKKELRDRGK